MRRFVLLVLALSFLFISPKAFCEENAENINNAQIDQIKEQVSTETNNNKKFLKKSNTREITKKQTEDLAENKNEEETDVLHGFIEYYPEGTIFFDEIKEAEGVFLNIKRPTTYNQYSVLDIKGVNYEEIKNRQKGIKRHISNEYQIADFSSEYTEKIGKFSYGTSYGADIDTGEFEYNTKFFARYDSKRYAFQVAYGKNAYTSTGTQADYVYVTPEWKIGKGFVLKDTFKANTLGIKHDNEIVLQYTPQFIKENPLDIELGVGQSYYQDGSQNSVFKFATTLRL